MIKRLKIMKVYHFFYQNYPYRTLILSTHETLILKNILLNLLENTENDYIKFCFYL